jgi:AraC-like DNA-binding protein
MDLLFDFTASDGLAATVVGTMSKPLLVQTAGPVDLLGVRFRPAGLGALLHMKAAELTDERVDLTHFAAGWAREVWLRLAETPLDDRVPVLEQALGRLACDPAAADPALLYCIDRLEGTRGALRIADLAAEAGLGERRLERLFLRHVGIAPKSFARVVRFRSLLKAVPSSPVGTDWAGMAAELGYADQAHLVREFKAFSGLSPAAYLRNDFT